jgi:hypothetical protein
MTPVFTSEDAAGAGAPVDIRCSDGIFAVIGAICSICCGSGTGRV